MSTQASRERSSLAALGTGWLVAGVMTAALSLAQLLDSWNDVGYSTSQHVAGIVTALLGGFAVALAGRRPAWALGVSWVAGAFFLASGLLTFLFAQVALVAVAFTCGSRGRRTTVVAALCSGPLVVVIFLSLALGSDLWILLAGTVRSGNLVEFLRTAPVLVAGVLISMAPTVLGILQRQKRTSRALEAGEADARREAEVAYADAATARELARLQESHAQLARDVHDVVGHSLTVVIAQAEAAQYAGDDPDTLRGTLGTIADTARTSLADVRRVLADTDGEARRPTPSPVGASDPLPELVAGMRAGGHTVEVFEEGSPRPLPPELATVAHRVTQEMLTNAARHGDPAATIEVERHWDGDELRLEVCNALTRGHASDDDETRPLAGATPGRGLDGMQDRLAAVGGRLDVRRRESRGDEAGTFTATAWIPLRPVGPSATGEAAR